MEPVDDSSQTTEQIEQALIRDIEDFMAQTKPAQGDIVSLLKSLLEQGAPAEEVAVQLAEAGMLAEGVYQPPAAEPELEGAEPELEGEEEPTSESPPKKSRQDRMMEAATRAMGQ